MSQKPTSYHYERFKDDVKWRGLKPKDYVYLVNNMFNTYVSNLPKPKAKRKR